MVKDFDINDLMDASRVRQLINHVKKGKAQYVLKENGEPLAMLLSLDEVEQRNKDKEKAWRDLFQVMDKVHAANAQFSAAEVEADVDAAIQETRQARKHR